LLIALWKHTRSSLSMSDDSRKVFPRFQ